MGSLLSWCRDEHQAFADWCTKNGRLNGYTYRDWSLHPDFEEYDRPRKEAEAKKQAARDQENHLLRLKLGSEIGCLGDSWLTADVSKVACPKCGRPGMRRVSGWLLSDHFGCPGCGHTEGLEW